MTPEEKQAIEAHSQAIAEILYRNTAVEQLTREEVEYLTGMKISKSVQQRLIHRQKFELPSAEAPVSEVSVDGGNLPCPNTKKLMKLLNYLVTVLSSKLKTFVLI